MGKHRALSLPIYRVSEHEEEFDIWVDVSDGVGRGPEEFLRPRGVLRRVHLLEAVPDVHRITVTCSRKEEVIFSAKFSYIRIH